MKIFEIKRFGKSYDPGKGKRKKRNALAGVIVFLVISIVLVTAVTIGVEVVIKRYVIFDQTEVWVAAVASYWGGIIGGVVSGILAFLGVFYTIRYYKESDAQKERASEQPFLMVELGQDPKHDPKTGFSLGDQTDDKEKQTTIYVSIKNIGHGFAKTLVIHTGYNLGGLAFNKVINVGDCAYTFFVLNRDDLNEGVPFALQYIDSMTNEYIQEYTLKAEHGSIVVECEYPQLLEQ